MRRPAFLIAAGVAAFLLFLLAFVPAALLLRYLPPGVVLNGVTGSIWRGHANAVTVHGKPLGSLSWSNRPWRLASLELSYDVNLRPAEGNIGLIVSLAKAEQLVLSNLKGQFPLMLVDGLFAPAGWKGTADLDVGELVLVSGYPERVTGTVVVHDLTAPGPGGLDIGNFEITLGEGSVGGDAISGRLRDLGGGPIKVRATLAVKADRSYLLSGEVTTRPGANPVIERDLAFLGPPDSLGRRSFGIEGTL
jgi:general secretion pathway protein N